MRQQMNHPIRIKRPSSASSAYEVLKNGHLVARIRRSTKEEPGHQPEAPWLLETVSGRIDRHGYYQDAVSDAYKI